MYLVLDTNLTLTLDVEFNIEFGHRNLTNDDDSCCDWLNVSSLKSNKSETTGGNIGTG